MKLHFNLEDLSQIAIGAFVLAVPISFSEEAWQLGESLPIFNLLLLSSLSFLFLAFFTHQSLFQGSIRYGYTVFFFRILVAYFIAAIVVALILFSIDKLPLMDAPEVALRRLIVIIMPAILT